VNRGEGLGVRGEGSRGDSNPSPLTPNPYDGYLLKAEIAARARELGFDLVRFTSADPFPGARRVLEERIAQGLFSGLAWFTAERASVAGDPARLMPGVRTIVSLGISYLSRGEGLGVRDEGVRGDSNPSPLTPNPYKEEI
jgi:hypothetical protein